jgi:hypothetical protein
MNAAGYRRGAIKLAPRKQDPIAAAQLFSTAENLSWKSDRGSTTVRCNVGESPVRGPKMQPAFEISLALWGMIVCAAVEAVQFLESVL